MLGKKERQNAVLHVDENVAKKENNWLRAWQQRGCESGKGGGHGNRGMCLSHKKEAGKVYAASVLHGSCC